MEMPSKKSLAVIMTVHNRRDTTLECIKRFYSVQSIERYNVDFYLMDDGSTDGTSESVKKAYPQVRLLKGDGSLFWNRGMYVCWKEAVKKYHDFYLWLNDDTLLFNNALKVLFEDYSLSGDLSIITGGCCDSSTHCNATYGGRSGGKMVCPTGKPQAIEKMNGNVVLIPNCVYERIGLNDPRYRHAIGDYEYGMRAKRNGVNVVLSSSFVASCDRHDADVKSFSSDYKLYERMKFLYSIRYDLMGQCYFVKKYYSIRDAVKLFLSLNYHALFAKPI